MRGCVAAGMASCIHFLGLADSFDGVYGASAGSLVGERERERALRLVVYGPSLRAEFSVWAFGPSLQAEPTG